MNETPYDDSVYTPGERLARGIPNPKPRAYTVPPSYRCVAHTLDLLYRAGCDVVNTPGGWQCNCPAHSRRRVLLNITASERTCPRGTYYTTLLHCSEDGCTPDNIQNVLRLKTFAELLEPLDGPFADSHDASADQAPPPRRFPFITSAQFAAGDYRPEWLVKGLLVRNQPGGIAGPSKSLKTNLAIDFGVSLASGTPFLGQFDVPHPTRVAIVSGESGEHTLQETARRICAARGLTLESLGENLQWCFNLPTFSDLAGMVEYTKELIKLECAANIIDPLYQSLGAVDARNLFEMGEALKAVGNMILKAGATPLLVHHSNGRLQRGDVMQLSDLAYSGLEQYLRQWLLINRLEEYRGDGVHKLTVNIGGSAGQSKLLAVDIDEGVIDDNFKGRKWELLVRSFGELKEEQAHSREEKKITSERITEKRHEAFVFDAIDEAVKARRKGATLSDMKRGGLSGSTAKKAIDRLLEEGVIEEVKVKKNTREYEGYRRAKMVKQARVCDEEMSPGQ